MWCMCWALQQLGASWRRVTAKSCLPHLPICIARQFKSKNEAEKRKSVMWIEYTPPHLYLQAISQFSNGLSDFFISTRRLASKAVCSIIQCLLEVVICGANYQKIFVAIASGFNIVVNRRGTVCARFSGSTVLEMSLMHRLLVITELRSWASVILFHPLLLKKWCQLMILLLWLP